MIKKYLEPLKLKKKPTNKLILFMRIKKTVL